MKHTNGHTKRVMETWLEDCVEGECEHGPEDYADYAMENCPSSMTECCVECTTGERPELFDDWDGYVVPWPVGEVVSGE